MALRRIKKILKWSPSELKSAFFPLSLLSCIFGYKVFEFPIGNRRPLITYVYTITIIFLLSLTFIREGYNKCNYGKTLLHTKPLLLDIVWGIAQFTAIVSVFVTLRYSQVKIHDLHIQKFIHLQILFTSIFF